MTKYRTAITLSWDLGDYPPRRGRAAALLGSVRIDGVETPAWLWIDEHGVMRADLLEPVDVEPDEVLELDRGDGTARGVRAQHAAAHPEGPADFDG